MNRIALWGVPVFFGLILIVSVLCRPARVENAPPAKKPPAETVPIAAQPERPPSPGKTAQAAEEAQVRTLVRRLAESAARGDEPTQEAMVLGLKRWKTAPRVIEEELARTSDPGAQEALRRALTEIKP